jgi:hypothetical protein
LCFRFIAAGVCLNGTDSIPSRSDSGSYRSSTSQSIGRRELSLRFGATLSLRAFFRTLFVGGILALALVQQAPAAVQDDFETPEASWHPGDADASYRVESHQRITADPHSGRASELVQINAGTGTYVYFTHEMGTARIVAELSPSVWVKANRPGIQLLARVILPHTTDPRTGKPMATLIAGTSYSGAGSWQQLRIDDTPQLLSRQVRVLRVQLGPQVDGREAYIDQLVLNVFGGPGQTIVNVDDLEVNGIVPSGHFAQTAVAASNAASGASDLANPPQTTVDASAGASTGQRTSAPTGPVHQVTFNGSMLLVDGRPMFPRIIQSQGEPFRWLAQAGFNTVRVTAPITDEMLAEAAQAGVWLIGPPPQLNPQNLANNSAGAPNSAPISPAYSPVLAWHLGSGLAARELSETAALAKQVRGADRQLRRPLVCMPEEESLAYSRHVDALCEACYPLGTSLELRDYGRWLTDRPRLARAGTPLWAVVQTELAPTVFEQAAALAGRESSPPEIEGDSLRLLTYQAFCGGVRGIEFASSSRLDASDVPTRLRATSLALLNLELELLEPWGAAGSYVTTTTSNDPDLGGVVLNADKARLVVAMRLNSGSQYVAAPQTSGTVLSGATSQASNRKSSQPDSNLAVKDTSKLLRRSAEGGNTMSDNVGDQTHLPSAVNNPLFPEAGASSRPSTATLVVPGVPDDYNVYEITPAGLRPLRHRRIAGGTAIAVEDFLLTSLILMTSDPAVENALRMRTSQLAPRAAKLQRELTALTREQVAAVDARLTDHIQYPSASSAVATAGAGLQSADQLLAAADAAQSRDQLQAAGFYSQAYLAARNAAYSLAHWKRSVWEKSTSTFSSPVTSPLAVDFNTLPEQIKFAAAITGPTPGENLLVGGDFENLQTMLQAGWRNAEHPRSDLQTGVELSPLAPFNGGHSLHLQVQPVKQQSATALAAQLVESPPLWVTTAPVHLAAGEVVCIRGQIRIAQPIVGSVDGLMIIDSLGGPPLALRMNQTDGWKEFVMYRAVPYAQDVTVTFALTGIGQVWVDDVTIRRIPSSGDSLSAMSGMPMGR